MAYQVAWTRPAADDLEAIHNYISASSVQYADNMVDRILSAIDRLADFPLMGRSLPERNDVAYRDLIVRPYRVVYKVLPDRVQIIAVVHGARQLDDAIGDRLP